MMFYESTLGMTKYLYLQTEYLSFKIFFARFVVNSCNNTGRILDTLIH